MTAEDDTRRGVNSVQRRFERLRRTSARVLRNIGIGLGASLTGAAAIVRQLVVDFERIGRAAAELGVTPSTLRSLEELERRVGVAQGGFTRLVTRFRTGSDSVSEALRRLGIDVERFGQLSGGQQLLGVVEQLARIENASERTAAAVALAGDELGRDLLRIAGAGNLREVLGRIRSQERNIADALAGPAQRAGNAFRDLWFDVQNGAISAFGTLQRLVEGTRIGQLAVGFRETREGARLAAAAVDQLASEVDRLQFARATFADPNTVAQADKLAEAAKEAADEAERAEDAAERRLELEIRALEILRDRLRGERGGTVNLREFEQAPAPPTSPLLQSVEAQLARRQQAQQLDVLRELLELQRSGNAATFL